MEYFMEVFGGYSIGRAAVVAAAVIFLFACYRKVETYFSEKAVRDKEKADQIQEVIEQAKNYPHWHKQSIDIRDHLNEAINEMGEKLDQVNQSIEELKKENSEDRATTGRYRILRFNDEILHDERHTKEHFDQVLGDIKEYEKYCDTHPEYENDKAVLAIENIRRVYRKCRDEGTFL